MAGEKGLRSLDHPHRVLEGGGWPLEFHFSLWEDSRNGIGGPPPFPLMVRGIVVPPKVQELFAQGALATAESCECSTELGSPTVARRLPNCQVLFVAAGVDAETGVRR